jgi:hypothetical protein
MLQITIGATPREEPCAAIGQPDYLSQFLLETMVFHRMLQRLFPATNVPAYFSMQTFTNDFGSYHEVCLSYDESSPKARTFAKKVLEEEPEYWDARALFELAWFERNDGYRNAVRSGMISEDKIPLMYRGTLPNVADRTLLEMLPALPWQTICHAHA